DEALVQVAGLVDPAVVVVAAAQDALLGGGGGAGVGEADVGVEGDAVALGVEGVAGGLGLVGATEWGAADGLAADRLLLLEHADAIPELDVLADRAHHHVAAAGRPGGLAGGRAHPDELVHERGVGDLGVGGAVAEGEQVAGVGLGAAVARRGLE